MLCAEHKVSLTSLMIELLEWPSRLSVVPVSDFRVGAIALGSSGALYFGCNIEIPTASLCYTTHAEQTAVTNAIIHAEKKIEAIAVSAAPCGYCRQFLFELSNAKELKIILDEDQVNLLPHFLPGAFGPENLGNINGLTVQQHHSMVMDDDTGDDMANEALRMANQSYAPYSSAFAGVAIATRDQVFAGPYIENVAFNPSLSPIQSALTLLVLSGKRFDDIRRIYLVESQKGSISHLSATRSIGNSIAPGISIEYSQAVPG